MANKDKFKTKIQLMWEVSKEQEANFRYLISEKYPSNIVEGMDIDELFKLIRGSEYRRGKEDALKERDKEILDVIKNFSYTKYADFDDCNYEEAQPSVDSDELIKDLIKAIDLRGKNE